MCDRKKRKLIDRESLFYLLLAGGFAKAISSFKAIWLEAMLEPVGVSPRFRLI